MNKKNTTIEDLAGMVARGFENTATKADVGRLEKRMDGLEKNMDGFEKNMDGFQKTMGNLESGQEDIKLKLDNVAYRFELVELQRRVEILEKKAGVKK